MSSGDTAQRDYTEAVAAEVRGAAAKARVKQNFIAKALGVSQQALSRRWTGELPFDVDWLYVIASILDIPITDLLPPTPVGAEPLQTVTSGRKVVPIAGKKSSTRRNMVYNLTVSRDNLRTVA